MNNIVDYYYTILFNNLFSYSLLFLYITNEQYCRIVINNNTMILKDELSEIIRRQKEEISRLELGTIRTKLNDIAFASNHAIIITGIRRSGKSTLLKQIFSRIKSFNYLNFEDIRLTSFTVEDFPKLFELFNETSKSEYYFFDEIQNIPGWEKFIRELIDKKKKVILTGSNASMLSRELGTKLTGRHLRYELFPFSYNEFLSYTKSSNSLNSFGKYFESGGFPEYLSSNNNQILQELFRDIIERDIIVRYKIRHTKLLKELAIYLLTNAGREFSYQSLRKIFNLSSPNTIISAVGYFEECYLFFVVHKFDYSYRKQLINQKKLYSIDLAFIRANTSSLNKDSGPLFENLIFLNLKSKYNEVFYYKDSRECDFITKDNNNKLRAFQVCYNLTQENKDREIEGLVEALNYIKSEKGVIITYSQEDNFKIDEKNIEVVPAYKWMTEN